RPCRLACFCHDASLLLRLARSPSGRSRAIFCGSKAGIRPPCGFANVAAALPILLRAGDCIATRALEDRIASLREIAAATLASLFDRGHQNGIGSLTTRGVFLPLWLLSLPLCAVMRVQLF